ncbi:MAG TPA: MBL fold metallo-hydrolase [Alkalispirochaeta sp.]|nr:MBL fold metallo-hydrolase [Alkalispirochaeta sp.]
MTTHHTTITTLIENRPGAHRGLATEHGISFLVEHNGHTILFDTGQSGAIVDNARVLNHHLSKVEHVVLSHGHYDHTNGLPRLLEHWDRAEAPLPHLHVHRHFFDAKYAAAGPALTYIGPSWDRQWCERQGVSVDMVDGAGGELVPGVHIVTGFDRTHQREVKNPRFVVERTPGATPEVDDFRDEISLVVETDRGLVVLVGCSHPGIMNMLDTIRPRFAQPLHAVLGGTHLVEAHGERLVEARAYLQDPATGTLGLSHCTGDEAMALLEGDNGPRFYRNVTGSSLSV